MSVFRGLAELILVILRVEYPVIFKKHEMEPYVRARKRGNEVIF